MTTSNTASPNQKSRKESNFSPDEWRSKIDPPPVLADYLPKRQTARELNVSERTLDRWHSLGTGPKRLRVGGKTYYGRHAIAQWLEAQEQGVA